MVRKEQEIFDELAALCISPGYAHAIANLCFRDNVVRFAGELTAEDMAHLFSASRLIRTEISILIGLLTRQSVDYTLPTPKVIQAYMDQTDRLGYFQSRQRMRSALERRGAHRRSHKFRHSHERLGRNRSMERNHRRISGDR